MENTNSKCKYYHWYTTRINEKVSERNSVPLDEI